MKYIIDLTEKQKAQMDCMMEIVHRYVGFNPKLEPIEYSWESDLEKHRKQAYDKGYEDGAKNQDEVQYQKGYEDGKKWAIDENAKDHQGYYNKGLEDGYQGYKYLNQWFADTCFFEDEDNLFPEYKRRQADTCCLEDIITDVGFAEVLNRVKAYEEKKKAEEESIKVGDIVIHKDDKIKGVVYRVEDGLAYGTNCYLNSFEWATNLCTKVGHIDEMETLLNKLRGEDNE